VEIGGKMPSLGEERERGLVLLGDLWSLTGDIEQANQSYDQALEAVTDPGVRRWISNKRHGPHRLVRDGARISFYEHGSGENTLVFIHPLIYGLAVFQPILERLCQEFRIITVDPRGTGASDPLPPSYTINEHAEDVRSVIEASGAAPCIGVGISRGGNLLVNLTVTHPDLMQKLVLVGTNRSPGNLYVRERNWTGELRELVRRRNVEGAIRMFLSRVYSEPETRDLVEQRLENCLRLPVDTLLGFFSPDPGVDISPLLGRVRAPTLVMNGADDHLHSIEDARDLVRRIPRAEFYAFKGRGHLPVFTATSEFCEVLSHFVRTGIVPEEIRFHP
jgi:pimeloyl-ACP methyl ester carboxylesterase